MKLRIFNNKIASKAEKTNSDSIVSQILDKIDEEAKSGEFEFYATVPTSIIKEVKKVLNSKHYPSVIKDDAKSNDKVIAIYWGPSTMKMSPYYQLSKRQWYAQRGNDGFKIFT